MQSVCWALPCRDLEFVGHAWQIFVLEPTAVEYCPSAQREHEKLPFTVLNFPATHCVQLTPFCPDLQATVAWSSFLSFFLALWEFLLFLGCHFLFVCLFVFLFQMKVDFHFSTLKLGFLNISEFLARYGIQMDPSVTERW